MLDVIHLIHLISAVTWGGGLMYQSLAFYPLLARQSGEEAHRLLKQMAPLSSTLMWIAGLTAMLSGGARAWMGGVQSWGDLTEGYGRTVLIAFLVAFFYLGAVDGMFRRRFRLMMLRPVEFAEKARPMARKNALLMGGGILVTITLMAALRLGWS